MDDIKGMNYQIFPFQENLVFIIEFIESWKIISELGSILHHF